MSRSARVRPASARPRKVLKFESLEGRELLSTGLSPINPIQALRAEAVVRAFDHLQGGHGLQAQARLAQETRGLALASFRAFSRFPGTTFPTSLGASTTTVSESNPTSVTTTTTTSTTPVSTANGGSTTTSTTPVSTGSSGSTTSPDSPAATLAGTTSNGASAITWVATPVSTTSSTSTASASTTTATNVPTQAPVIAMATTAPTAGPAAATAAQGGSATPAATLASTPYTPAQVRAAYGINQVSQTGAGQTIAIVDAYDDPTIAQDLNTFDQQFGLPAANLVKVVPSSGTPAYNSGWAQEISLDVEWAHAVAPGATIMLIEAPSSSLSDLFSGVNYAVSQGVKQVSMSWGGGDFSGESYYDSNFKASGVTFLASAGDSGAGVNYPAASPYVTAVGGTSLQLTTSNTRYSETAWSGSGGGYSANEARPTYQKGFVTTNNRGVPDVSYDADPNTGFYVYDNGSWYDVGGTSAGAPQWAGLVALANQGRAAVGKASLGTGLTYGTNQVLYSLAGGSSYRNSAGDFVDITSGSNGYSATTGYDPVTGLGSPNAGVLIPALINA